MSTESLIQSLSLEEKVSLLAGHSYWRTASLPQHGIKPIKYSDGPNGVRGESIHASTKATCFPCAACVGATFNPALALKMGRVIGQESRAKGIGLVLGPTVNLHRSPLGGRNFEAYSEDPTLSGILGASFVNGVQAEGVAACPKHFVANECETHRKTSNSIVDEKTLRELYAYSFQVLLKNATPWCIMTSYNLVNGVFMSENRALLQGLLRKEWGYEGAIVSDFEGVYSTVPSVIAGVALELPGPARFRGEKLLQAVQDGQVPKSQIDTLVSNVITLASKVGMEDQSIVEKDTERTEGTTGLLRDIAAEGIVLLKNKDNILPILPAKRPKIAVFGSPAATPIIHGGGSASLTPVYGKENITYHPGVPIFKKIPSASTSVMRTLSTGQPGVDCYWYNGWTIGENQIYHEVLESTRTLVIEPRISQLEPTHCSRMSFILKPTTSGTHAFGVTACGKCVLRVDDEVILEHAGFTDVRVEYVMQPGDFEVRTSLNMVAGRDYRITVDTLSTTAPVPSPIFQITPQATSVGFYENLDNPLGEDALALARSSDVSVIFTANNKEYESESFDRSSMSLSPLQEDLIRTIAAAAPRSVLVNQTGSPISMPWIDDVDAVIQCWYAGQEVGNALVDIMSGEVNPSGKLPVTFPRVIEDTLSFGNFPTNEKMEVQYAEGLEMGYRASRKPAPLFPFGFGLSYTRFSFLGFCVKQEDASSPSDVDVTVALTVANDGLVKGKEVVQVYVDGVLKGFQKVSLEVGQSQQVEIPLDKYAFSEWNPDVGSWVVASREYAIELRQDARTRIALLTHTIESRTCWNGI
ncbi:glycoside hydrolase superfamily [Aspergillus keveii]|uniref:beta-glucosidase n=1 Tax=Aspergillus keveii TaxID=714993 RepID=A0ABR4FN58_9EURO